MGKLRFYAAVFAGKIIYSIEKLLGKNATVFPGTMAIRICPDVLRRLEKPKQIIGITGTNGKTTVTNMIISFYERKGYSVVHNSLGSNVAGGIVTSLLCNSTICGKTKKDIAILEIDEKSTRLIFPYMEPDWLVCTNLFRDSTKRNAHTEYIAGILNKYIPAKTKLVLNADDLISSRLAESNERVYFGIERQAWETENANNLVRDITICPKCDTRLHYDFARYHHIGKAHCPECGFASAEADYLVKKIDFEAGSMSVQAKGKSEEYELISENIVNIYNHITCVALLTELGFSEEDIKEHVNRSSIVASRFSIVEAEGVKLITQFAKEKNSVACSRSFEFINKYDSPAKSVFLMLDDTFEEKKGSENVSWLYDADFEFLNDETVKRIVVFGTRAIDTKLRLLLAGVSEDIIFLAESEEEIVDKVLDVDKLDTIFVMHSVCDIDMAGRVKSLMLEKVVDRNA